MQRHRMDGGDLEVHHRVRPGPVRATPLPAEELDEDDPHDIVGAITWLTGHPDEIDGVDIFTDRSAGYQLRPENGEEVAD
ncbi:hypothetical protein ATKI12_0020 [Kitasatospora sp. Ki12]